MSTAKQKVLLSSVGTVAVTLMLAASSWAMTDGVKQHNPEHKLERKLERMTRHLDLTEEQQAQVEALLGETQAQRVADRQRLKELRTLLHEQRADFDAATVQQTADEIGELTSRKLYARTSTQAQIYSLLSADQQAKMDEMHEKRRMHKRHKRAHRMM
ncbi:MAG: Spy/CpxP family protein refolding chaperone [Halioglobus sp.]